ncbi:MAG TPA: hypothetical protein VJU34_13355, partial [Phenylobacterium sp.]|nr:hypothetical protein [Phenylobacterium sp.]
MSTDFTGRESDEPLTDQEGGMFAAQPIWERNRKKKGFGLRKGAGAPPVAAPEPRSFAAEPDEEPLALDTPVDSPLDRPVASPPIAGAAYATMTPSAARPSTLAAETDADA